MQSCRAKKVKSLEQCYITALLAGAAPDQAAKDNHDHTHGESSLCP